MRMGLPVGAPRRLVPARLATLALAATALAGCYEYVPVSTVPTGKPQVVEVLLNERGRADLVNRLGPDVLSFVGALEGKRDSTLSIRVQEVTYISRSTVQWSGEPMNVTDGQVRDVRARRVARGKTVLAIASSIGVAVVFVLTRTLTGGGTPLEGGSPPPSQPN